MKRMHAGTEWQTALPQIEASPGFQMQLLPLTCVFSVAPKYPLGDSQGRVSPSAWLPSPAPQRHLGKAGQVRRARQSRGKTAGRRPRSWGLVPNLAPHELLASPCPIEGRSFLSQKGHSELISRNAIMGTHFTYLEFLLILTIHISLEVIRVYCRKIGR